MKPQRRGNKKLMEIAKKEVPGVHVFWMRKPSGPFVLILMKPNGRFKRRRDAIGVALNCPRISDI
jgi:hypothetical protein